ncbi:hypothetical protein GY45DRAFT_1439547 [Cubamyces sp. BRFM 1775]|nr:hypothetical protein GY45DRAFT_1439547 [Cubamyces sp. BRFM 1775]
MLGGAGAKKRAAWDEYHRQKDAGFRDAIGELSAQVPEDHHASESHETQARDGEQQAPGRTDETMTGGPVDLRKVATRNSAAKTRHDTSYGQIALHAQPRALWARCATAQYAYSSATCPPCLKSTFLNPSTLPARARPSPATFARRLSEQRATRVPLSTCLHENLRLRAVLAAHLPLPPDKRNTRCVSTSLSSSCIATLNLAATPTIALALALALAFSLPLLRSTGYVPACEAGEFA